ncbi:MAG TPA: hypothetical protein VGQ83_28925 [Polyangia bacterium]
MSRAGLLVLAVLGLALLALALLAAPAAAAPAAAAAPEAEVEPPLEPAPRRAAAATIARLLARFDDEPSVDELCRAAARAARVHPELAASWLRRAGKAASLPTLRLRLERGVGRDTSLAALKEYDQTAIRTGDDLVYEVGLTWRLDRLIFDVDELRAGREARQLAKMRHEIQAQVIRLYFERRRLQVEELLDAADDLGGALRRALRIRELGAVLDALTGGRLSDGGRGRTARRD